MRTRILLSFCLLALALPARADPNIAEITGWCVLGTVMSVLAQDLTDNGCSRRRHDLDVNIAIPDRIVLGNVRIPGESCH